MAYLNRNQELSQADPIISDLIYQEGQRQDNHLELIASENISSKAVREAMGSVLTDKYAEGYPNKRYYGGCQIVDKVEEIAIERLKKIYGAEHVNVQPHSGAQANMAVYFAFLKPGDTLMAMNLSHGGHLTHGSPVSFSGHLYNIIPYGVRQDTEQIDYDELREIALKHKPKMIVSGASAYPRAIDFKKFYDISREVGAYHMCDMAHYSGLVAGGVYPSPIPYADFVTSTTHKSIRGPRGGMILCKSEYAKEIDKSVFPGIQGGPLMHVIAAKAVCYLEALQPEFKEYQKQIIANAKVLASALENHGLRVVSGGTDSHMVLLDLRPFEITGKLAQITLDQVHITTNKNAIPYDPEKPFVTSGLRIGTPAVTSRGMKENEMNRIADLLVRGLKSHDNPSELENVRQEVINLCKNFPLNYS